MQGLVLPYTEHSELKADTRTWCTHICGPCLYYFTVRLLQFSSSWPVTETAPKIATYPEYRRSAGHWVSKVRSHHSYIEGTALASGNGADPIQDAHDRIQGTKWSGTGIFGRTDSREGQHQNTQIIQWTDSYRPQVQVEDIWIECVLCCCANNVE